MAAEEDVKQRQIVETHVPEILATMFGALSVAVSLLKIHKLMLRFCLERCLLFGFILVSLLLSHF
jgi:hypothetical protein